MTLPSIERTKAMETGTWAMVSHLSDGSVSVALSSGAVKTFTRAEYTALVTEAARRATARIISDLTAPGSEGKEG